jgi:cell division protein FtsI/penicillin-binding protein 2
MSLTSRACIACYGFAAIFTGLSTRLVYLAVNKHEYYSNHARETYTAKVSIPARRGAILDAKGSVLARNEPQKNVIADGTLLVFEKKEGKKKTIVDLRPELAALLAEPLGMTAEAIVNRIRPTDRYVVLKNKISEETASEIERRIAEFEEHRSKALRRPVDDVRVKGLRFEPNFERVYPEHQLLCHVVGFYGFEDVLDKEGKPMGGGRFKGIEGIERSMDDWLSGQDGWRYFEKDGRGREIVSYRTEDRRPRNGSDVQLTVDLGLQQIVEAELEAACRKYRPIKASVVMMNPKTGEILALANRPCFDPNEPGKAQPEERFDHVVAGLYEPGSTMKVMTCAGGLNYHKVSLDTEIFCENGVWNYGGKPLHDHHAYGMLTVAQILEKSSSIGAAKIAVGMGEETFHGWLRKFGFGQNTGIALPGEVRGSLKPRAQWSGISITRMAMGHEVDVTPLQMVTATSVIANGGKLMMPQILKRIVDENGKTIKEYAPQEVRQVLSPETAALVREALIRVTGKKGTAKLAHIAGYLIAGKTGTSQKLVDGRYSKLKHVTSFSGFVPAEDPAFCMLITLDEAQVPSNEDTGGLIVAPIFKAIAERALSYLGVPPDPLLLQKDLQEAKEVARNNR